MSQRSLGEAAGARSVLYFTSHTKNIGLRGESVFFEESGEETRFAFQDIRRVVLVGKPNVPLAVVQKLMRRGITVDWLDIFGKPVGQILANDEGRGVHLKKQIEFAESGHALELAKTVLGAKMDNCAHIVARKIELPEEYHNLRRELASATEAASIRGVEGDAARLYFQSWKGHLHEFEWHGRVPHPAPDPVNTLLSTGYGMLRNRLASALYFAGLEPRQAYFHETRGTHCALASDLMEPLRALVDSAVLKIIDLGEVKPAHFAVRGEYCACADKTAFLKILLNFEKMFSMRHRFFPDSAGKDGIYISLNECIEKLAAGFANYIAAGETFFLPRLSPCNTIWSHMK